MQGTMKAGTLVAPNKPLEVVDLPIPEIGPGEVLVHSLRAGTNRGDVHHMIRGEIELDRGVESVQIPDLPLTMGHDGFGEVAEVGPGVTSVRVGDLVAAKCILTCGFCKFCRREREHLCIHHRIMGYLTLSTEWGSKEKDIFRRYKDGWWAEYARIPATNVERMRPDDDIDAMSKVSQIAVGYRALKRARLSPGETVIVSGATGITGVGAVLSALAMGAAKVIAVARHGGRLETLRAVNPRRISPISVLAESARERVMEITEGEGAQVLVDLSPANAQLMVDLVHSLEPGGRAVLQSGHNEDLTIGYRFLMIRSPEFLSTHGRYYVDFPELYNLVRCGAMDVSVITPRFFRVDQIREAYATFDERGDNAITWPMMRNEPLPELVKAREGLLATAGSSR